MPLLDDLGTPNGGCGYRNALAALTDEDAAGVRAAVADPAWGPTVLSRKLAEYGIDMSHQVIGRHRKQECKACL